ncbi:GldM family protein [Flavobacterium sp.]|uniref:GldM family protein n=1 Tax=Flavobacterium sp. TaxID=239 RepID=UPI002605FCCC|nr:GldM family protein [Flavobacterium sp.]
MPRILHSFFLFISFFSLAQKDTLATIKHKSDWIVNQDIRVVYRGMPNTFSIEVPNSLSFSVSGLGVKSISKNTFEINPGAGTELNVSVQIVLKNKTKKEEVFVFKIRNIAVPLTSLNYNKDPILRMSKNNLKGAVVRIFFEDKNLDFKFNVLEFTLRIPGQKAIVVQGNTITSSVFDQINRYARKGDQLTICDIKTRVGIHNNRISICKITPVIITIL